MSEIKYSKVAVPTVDDLKNMELPEFAKIFMNQQIEKWQEDMLYNLAGEKMNFIKAPKPHGKMFISNTPKGCAGLQGLHANGMTVIVDDPFAESLTTEKLLTIQEKFYNVDLKGNKVVPETGFKILSTHVDDYDDVPMSWWERFITFKWFTKTKKVYNPKAYKMDGWIVCSPRTKQYLENTIVSK